MRGNVGGNRAVFPGGRHTHHPEGWAVCMVRFGSRIGYTKIEKLARYSTKEKAVKAIEELRYAYLCHERLKQGAKLSDLPDDVTQNQVEGICGLYRFPQEDEVEV